MFPCFCCPAQRSQQCTHLCCTATVCTCPPLPPSLGFFCPCMHTCAAPIAACICLYQTLVFFIPACIHVIDTVPSLYVPSAWHVLPGMAGIPMLPSTGPLAGPSPPPCPLPPLSLLLGCMYNVMLNCKSCPALLIASADEHTRGALTSSDQGGR